MKENKKVPAGKQIELAGQVSDGELIVAEGSGHNVIPKKPRVVMDVIRKILVKL